MFVEQSAEQARLPVMLVSGFLGSGKTTLVNALLRDPALTDTAVAVNEFGEIPLDQHLIEQGGDRAVVLANGCLCCGLSGDLEPALMRIYDRREAGDLPKFKRLVIEPSGLADPAPIAQAIMRNPALSKALRLEGIVTVVDAVFGESQLTRHPESRRQIALADRLVLSKTDSATPAALESLKAALAGINPLSSFHLARHGVVDAAALLPYGFVHTEGSPASRKIKIGLVADLVKAEEADPDHSGETTAVSLVTSSALKWKEFEAWLKTIRLEHAPKVLRIKGLLNVAGTPSPVVIQTVEHVMSPPVKLHHWPNQDRRSRLVIVARDIPREVFVKSWEKALPGMTASVLSA